MPKRLNVVIAGLAAVALTACGVTVKENKGIDPCDPNPCEKAGACAGWTATCTVTEGKPVCSGWKKSDRADLTQPAKYEEKEVSCDNVDNDCDGLVDEGLTGDASACPGAGVCAGQTPLMACASGKWLCDWSAVAAYEATETTCDGKDNDCDGETDEALTAPLGACKRSGVCAGLGAPTCTAGAWACHYEKAADYEAPEATCDGKDNDCDGAIDVGLTPKALPAGKTCKTTGVCAAGVSVVCKGGAPVCDYAAVANFEAFEQTCDLKDNDCDGTADNIPGTALALLDVSVVDCKDKGVCAQAPAGALVKRCVGGALQCSYSSVPYYEATEALCDGRDNDCDGTADNITATPQTSPCGAKGVCAKGEVNCGGGLWTCDWAKLAKDEGYEAFEQTCDGKDNDCDGLTDEAPAPSKHGCNTKGVCGLGGVTVKCAAGKATCEYTGVPMYTDVTETTCDGLDNNCDGITDDGVCAKDAKCPADNACLSGKCTNGKCE